MKRNVAPIALFRETVADRLVTNDDGSVAVEFALVSVLLLSLMLAITETGLCFLFGLSLEGMTQQLARMIQTGQVQKMGVASLDDLKSKVICPSGGGGMLPTFVDCSRLIIDLRSADSYAADTSIGFYKSAPVYCGSGSGQPLVLRAAYAMPVFFPGLVLSNAVFGPSTAGLVDDYPGTVGWSHLLASGMILQIEGEADPASGAIAALTCP